MKDIKIILPDKMIFKLNLPVRIYDINYGNHLGHDSLISLLHETRVAFLKQHHLGEITSEQHGLIMASLYVEYKKQAFYGDHLEILLGVSNVKKSSFQFIYVVNNDKVEIARACTKMVFFDYRTQKIKKITDDFLQALIG